MRLLGWTAATAMPADRGGAAPPEGAAHRQRARHAAAPTSSTHIHDAGLKVAALCGSPYQALKHKDAGVDIVIAQGGEGGGHTGEVGSIVLWPAGRQGHRAHADARRRRHRLGRADRRRAGPRRPGRVGRLAVAHRRGGRPPAGAEAAAARRRRRATPCARRSFTGKPCRMLRNEWTEAWERARHPRPAADADAVHGVGQLRGPRPPLRRQGPGGAVQPGRPGRRPARTRSRRRPRSSSASSRSTSTPSTASTSSRRPDQPRTDRSARSHGPAPTRRVGLVLGAGGVAGGAFHAGVLAALAEATGWDPRHGQRRRRHVRGFDHRGLAPGGPARRRPARAGRGPPAVGRGPAGRAASVGPTRRARRCARPRAAAPAGRAGRHLARGRPASAGRPPRGAGRRPAAEGSVSTEMISEGIGGAVARRVAAPTRSGSAPCARPTAGGWCSAAATRGRPCPTRWRRRAPSRGSSAPVVIDGAAAHRRRRPLARPTPTCCSTPAARPRAGELTDVPPGSPTAAGCRPADAGVGRRAARRRRPRGSAGGGIPWWPSSPTRRCSPDGPERHGPTRGRHRRRRSSARRKLGARATCPTTGTVLTDDVRGSRCHTRDEPPPRGGREGALGPGARPSPACSCWWRSQPARLRRAPAAAYG